MSPDSSPTTSPRPTNSLSLSHSDQSSPNTPRKPSGKRVPFFFTPHSSIPSWFACSLLLSSYSFLVSFTFASPLTSASRPAAQEVVARAVVGRGINADHERCQLERSMPHLHLWPHFLLRLWLKAMMRLQMRGNSIALSRTPKRKRMVKEMRKMLTRIRLMLRTYFFFIFSSSSPFSAAVAHPSFSMFSLPLLIYLRPRNHQRILGRRSLSFLSSLSVAAIIALPLFVPPMKKTLLLVVLNELVHSPLYVLFHLPPSFLFTSSLSSVFFSLLYTPLSFCILWWLGSIPHSFSSSDLARWSDGLSWGERANEAEKSQESTWECWVQEVLNPCLSLSLFGSFFAVKEKPSHSFLESIVIRHRKIPLLNLWKSTFLVFSLPSIVSRSYDFPVLVTRHSHTVVQEELAPAFKAFEQKVSCWKTWNSRYGAWGIFPLSHHSSSLLVHSFHQFENQQLLSRVTRLVQQLEALGVAPKEW